MKIKCINNESYRISLELGKVYDAKKIADHFYALVDETGEEYGFPHALFEIIDD